MLIASCYVARMGYYSSINCYKICGSCQQILKDTWEIHVRNQGEVACKQELPLEPGMVGYAKVLYQ